jgi:hypothetical protein
MGQGVNLVTGDYSRGASGFWIENGEIAWPVEEITIAGQLREMLANLQGAGDDIDTRRNVHVGSLLVERMMVAGQQAVKTGDVRGETGEEVSWVSLLSPVSPLPASINSAGCLPHPG